MYPAISKDISWEPQGLISLVRVLFLTVKLFFMKNQSKDEKQAVLNVMKHLENILRIWLVDGNKDQMLRYHMQLSPIVQELIAQALKEVIAVSDNTEFRQAAIDIPAYIKANSQLSQYE